MAQSSFEDQASCRYSAEFEISTPAAGIIYRALLPEITADDHSRSEITCTVAGKDRIIITVRARDIPALRASLNLWLRLAVVSEEMHDIVRRHT